MTVREIIKTRGIDESLVENNVAFQVAIATNNLSLIADYLGYKTTEEETKEKEKNAYVQ